MEGTKKSKSRFFVTGKDDDDDHEASPKSNVIDLVESEESNDTPIITLDPVENEASSNHRDEIPFDKDYGNRKEQESVVVKEQSHDDNGDIGVENDHSTKTEELHPSKNERDNPFAKFAFSNSATATSPKRQASITAYFSSSSPGVTTVSNNDADVNGRKIKKPRTFQAGGTTWVKLRDLDDNEQQRIVTKWHSLIHSDHDGLSSSSLLEDRRFQVLVAARLHARCQEPAVRKAMTALRRRFHPFNVETIAHATQDDITACIGNLQYFNTKARHLISAANEIRTMYNGIVPEDEETLLKLKGIGPVMADLLSFVNTRAMHQAKLLQR